MVLERSESPGRNAGLVPGSSGSHNFPADLSTWTGRGFLFQTVQSAAAGGCGDSWLNLVSDPEGPVGGDDLLVLVGYCYLQGIYHSFDIIRRLDSDECLVHLRARLEIGPEQVRRFRREHRRALNDCLTRALVGLWRHRNPAAPHPVEEGDDLLRNRNNFRFLEPFYLQAQDRIDRAVILDSMALDY
jgi:hypothetical protein